MKKWNLEQEEKNYLCACVITLTMIASGIAGFIFGAVG